MALSNYTELRASIADWLNRQDLTPVIPDFIRLLEAQVQRTLRIREMFVETTLEMLPEDGGVLTLPDDFLAVRELRLVRAADGQVIPIAYGSKHELTEIQARVGGTGVPQAYCPGKDTIEFSPAPYESYTVKLSYVRKIPRLSSTLASNWLLEEHPDIYLYGSLMQAAPYLKNDERVPLWGEALNTILEDMRVADERALRAGTPLRMRFKPYG